MNKYNNYIKIVGSIVSVTRRQLSEPFDAWRRMINIKHLEIDVTVKLFTHSSLYSLFEVGHECKTFGCV